MDSGSQKYTCYLVAELAHIVCCQMVAQASCNFKVLAGFISIFQLD